MAAVSNNAVFAKKVGIPQHVGKEFINATPKGRFKKLKELVNKK